MYEAVERWAEGAGGGRAPAARWAGGRSRVAGCENAGRARPDARTLLSVQPKGSSLSSGYTLFFPPPPPPIITLYIC